MMWILYIANRITTQPKRDPVTVVLEGEYDTADNQTFLPLTAVCPQVTML